MPTLTDEKFFELTDFSGAIQRQTTKFIKKDNQVALAVNASFERLGGVQKVLGYTQVGNTITTTSSSTTTSTTSTSSTSTSTSSSSSSSTTSSSTTTMAP